MPRWQQKTFAACIETIFDCFSSLTWTNERDIKLIQLLLLLMFVAAAHIFRFPNIVRGIVFSGGTLCEINFTRHCLQGKGM